MTAALLALTAALAATPSFVDGLEETLDTLSIGPTIGAHVLVDHAGVAPAFAAGFEFVWFDVEKIYEPTCVEHRRRERAQLGASEGEVMDDLLEKAQQECPAIGSNVDLNFAFGGELDVAVRS